MKTIFPISTVAGVCLLMTISSTVWSQPSPTGSTNAAPAPTGKPTIQFADTVHNFGRVMAGEPVKAQFTFTNTGDATLEITAVSPHCGCTVAGTWDKKIEPGMTGTIPLQVNTINFNGPISKSATVTCNDSAHPSTNLQINGTVWKPLEVSPNVVSFNFPAGQPTNDSRTVSIKNNAEEPLTISEVHSENPAFLAELKEVTPGKQFDLVISTVPASITGRIQSTVTLKTSSTNATLVTITTLANPLPPVAPVSTSTNKP